MIAAILTNSKTMVIFAIAIALAAVFAWGWSCGSASVRRAWDADRIQAANTIAKLQAQQAEASARVVTEYVDRIKVVRERGKTIIEKVPVYVPTDSCDLPGGFRVLHDAAATNTVPDPARAPDAAAVPAQDAAATVADNYNTCQEIRNQLIAAQDWIKAQHGITENVK